METSCMTCGGHFYGRTDKKFCDDQCRSSFHNTRNSLSTNTMRLVHKKLRHNWTILHSHAHAGSKMISYEELEKDGFNLDQMTGMVREDTRILYCCYEYRYEVVNERGIVLHNSEPSDEELRPRGE